MDKAVLSEKTVKVLGDDGFVLCKNCHKLWTTEENGGICYVCYNCITEDEYILRTKWEYRTIDCTFCAHGDQHTLSQHQQALKAYDSMQAWKKGKTMNAKPIHHTHSLEYNCSFGCPAYTPTHNHGIEEKCNGLCPAWYLKVNKSDTYQGQKGPISINIPTENTTVVSEIRPFTLADKYECAERGMYAEQTKKKPPILANSVNIDGPAKPAPHVSKDDLFNALSKYSESVKSSDNMTWNKWQNITSSEYIKNYQWEVMRP